MMNIEVFKIIIDHIGDDIIQSVKSNKILEDGNISKSDVMYEDIFVNFYHIAKMSVHIYKPQGADKCKTVIHHIVLPMSLPVDDPWFTIRNEFVNVVSKILTDKWGFVVKKDSRLDFIVDFNQLYTNAVKFIDFNEPKNLASVI